MRLFAAALTLLALSFALPAWGEQHGEGTATLTAGTSNSFLAARGGRQSLLVQNIGAADAYCCLVTCPCVAAAGLLLTTPAGRINLEPFDNPSNAVCCISTAGSTVYYYEVYR